jgi:hypothetical protein
MGNTGNAFGKMIWKMVAGKPRGLEMLASRSMLE